MFSRLASAKSSLHVGLVYFRELEFEAIEENLVVVGWLRDAAFANFDAAACWQDDVHHS